MAVLLMILFIQGPATADIQKDAVLPERPDHVIVVIEENKSFDGIIGNKDALFINQLANQGALMTAFYALMHPSLPNYIVLFSGSTQGVKDDGCNYELKGANLEESLQKAGFKFETYAQSMPDAGFKGCGSGAYRKKHKSGGLFCPIVGRIKQAFSRLPQ